ncbi:hypothetical protein ACIA5D_27440 [Actinoplanes sp. NPDC051513]|uniref:hypothetical protein n=1 Tax=Actinoplanes sp. NPDC051513 TaxID=3363908 RepID=UPI00379EE4F8
MAAARVVEQGEAVVEAAGDLGDRQGLRAGGGQLDREGQAVQPANDGLDVVAGGDAAVAGRTLAEQGGTGRPASSASRISTSVVFPAGSVSGTPSRRSATGPRTATTSTDAA